jgi:hypothetical protein
MNTQAQQSLLRNFFSCYFHEDWPCEAESPEAVVAGYLRTATARDVRSLGQAIREYSRRFAFEKDLEERLFTDLGCYYRPSAQGISAKAWLEDIADRLLRETRS